MPAARTATGPIQLRKDLTLVNTPANVASIDWDAWTEQATTWLSEYLRVDTMNPPGNETRACEWIGRILDAEGIPYELVYPPISENHPERDLSRATLIARLPGDSSRGKALILLNHTDVVPFERDQWTVDPMGGEIHDGFIWGRGAMDMKSMGIMELVTFLLHRRHGLPLARDLVFMAVADEEAGSAWGVELLDCEYVINEGGGGSCEVLGVERNVMNIGVGEKGPMWLTLRAHGRPGHGSVPHDDNAADRLVRALHRILEWNRPLMPADEVRVYFQGLYEAGIIDREPTDEVLREIADQNPRMKSVQMNSISLTTLNAGVKHNVIPATAEATLDCRLVPGYDPLRFLEEMRNVIDDDGIEIEEVFVSSSPSTRLDTELYEVMSREARAAVEDVVVVPSVGTGFTDSRVFRRRGIAAYGFVPVLNGPDEQGRVHGNDERISIENLRLGMQILHHTVRGICG